MNYINDSRNNDRKRSRRKCGNDNDLLFVRRALFCFFGFRSQLPVLAVGLGVLGCCCFAVIYGCDLGCCGSRSCFGCGCACLSRSGGSYFARLVAYLNSGALDIGYG